MQNQGKKGLVKEMFDNIAYRYDFLNHFLSLGIDKSWRRKALKHLKSYKAPYILDVATGTGDLAISALRYKPSKIIGIDISTEMLRVGNEKIKNKGLQSIIELQPGDSEQINFGNETFDAVTVAFGVRNFENLTKGLQEMHRVLKTGGTAIILEFSKPTSKFFRWIYNFYFFHILPFFGRIVSKHHSAYTYLPESVDAFPCGEEFLAILKSVGFVQTKSQIVTFGIATIYIGIK